jgi:GNAT superfamily N-acetyltransferase
MITIQQASLQELDALAPLFDAYRQFYKQPPAIEGARAFLRERMEKKESVVFLAMEEGKAVGFTQLYPIFSSVSMRRAWLLNDLYVEAGARGKGAASRLLEAATDLGRQTGAAWLLLETAADNRQAQSVYERNGWRREEDFYYRYTL